MSNKMRFLMITLFCCVSATLASYTAAPSIPAGCGGDLNAEKKPCGDPCPTTCENKDAGPGLCAAICIVDGCGCKAGFVKDANGKCILPANCPVPSIPAGCGGDLNAEKKPCGDACPITCENKDAGGPKICPDICILDGCGCKAGFVKDVKGKCILPANCPKPTCAKNEVYSSCKNPCPETCEQLVSGGPQSLCLPIDPCPGGCDCASGYVRNKANVCVLPSQCPCPDPNAEFVNCPNPCPPTCNNLATVGKTPCSRLCIATGCTCKKGFVFDANGKCIKPCECPKICAK